MAERTWLVTGVSSGIGLELAREIVRRGDRLIGTVRRRPEPGSPLAELCGDAGDAVALEVLDVTDTTRMREVADQAWAAGPIDVVVSNAGYALFGAAETLADDEITRQIDTNLTASIHLARAVIPHLRAQGGGTIVQLSSMGGRIAFPGIGLYHATKWGVEGFFEAVAPEVAPFGIRVILAEPGTVHTAFTGRSARFGALHPAYGRGTPAGDVVEPLRAEAGRDEVLVADALPDEGASGSGSDPALVARAIAEAAASDRPPFRLPLGSDAFAAIEAHHERELAALRGLRDIAVATDRGTVTVG